MRAMRGSTTWLVPLACALLVRTGGAQAERPNVIVILTDDQGRGDLGFTGNPVIRTPNLDAHGPAQRAPDELLREPGCAPRRALA